MVRRIGQHGQEIVAVEHYPVEHDEVNAERANANVVKLPTRSNEFMRPCYFSPIQCLLRSPAQRRSFETQQQMINNKLFRDGKPFMKLANNRGSSSMDDENANFGQQKARQRIERQIALWKVGKTNQNELELSGTQQADTFRRHLFSNLWRS
uniref:Uncharacterized protein n=1 Tax=Globodera pallida TaxID=36090 RepID=A0A183BMW7_GLOPA